MTQSPETRSRTARRHLLFQLGENTYATPLEAVREVIAVPTATRIPEVPFYFEGVFDLRGETLPLIDLRKKFGLESQTPDRERSLRNQPCVIIVESQQRTLGCVVDDATQVAGYTEEEIDRSVNLPESRIRKSVEGVARGQENEVILLLDFPKLLEEDMNTVSSQETHTDKTHAHKKGEKACSKNCA